LRFNYPGEMMASLRRRNTSEKKRTRRPQWGDAATGPTDKWLLWGTGAFFLAIAKRAGRELAEALCEPNEPSELTAAFARYNRLVWRASGLWLIAYGVWLTNDMHITIFPLGWLLIAVVVLTICLIVVKLFARS
jgi:hypothetical protein